MKINCVVLNYNDADTVMSLLNRIRGFRCFENIVVVDNASTDNSWQRLKELQDDKIAVIQSEKNGGYGYGNNLGVRYAIQKNEATHVVIVNPDVKFRESTISKMARLFSHSEIGIVSPAMEDMQCSGLGRGWKLHGFIGELLAMGPVSRRIWGRFLNYPESYYKGKRAVYADVVHGSMLMVDAKAFLDCGGYDEDIFLYQEEAVLAWRMKTSGYRTVVLLTETYLHQHSTSITKSCNGQLQRQRMRHESLIYYMKNYLYINRFQEWFAGIWFEIILMEIRITKFLADTMNTRCIKTAAKGCKKEGRIC